MNNKYLSFAFAALVSVQVSAQNVPNGAGLPSGSLTGKVTTPLNFNQSPNVTPTTYNFVRTYSPLYPTTSIPTFDNTNGLYILVNTRFMDGFGTPLMDITRTNKFTDVVTPYFNHPGKISLSYLPYEANFHSKFRSDAYTSQRGYYKLKYSVEDTTAYAKTVTYSNQGLPTIKSYAPGAAFVGQERGTTTTMGFNQTGEVYKLYYSSGNICKSGTYTAGKLQATKTQGVDGAATITYKDNAGNLICKKEYSGIGTGHNGWLETYYVNNDLGQLICMVPPKASKQLISSTCLTDADKLCFFYEYNKYGEVVKKYTPGQTQPEVYIYDIRHRVVLAQNSALKDSNWYKFTIYDKRDRVVVSGIYDNGNNNYSDSTLQSLVTTGTTGAAILNYIHDGLSGSYPSSLTDCDLQIFNYYDDYANAPSGANSRTFNTSYSADYLTGTQMVTPEPTTFTHNKLVASRSKVVDYNGASTHMVNQFTTTVFFYDEKGRVIQTHTLNPWNSTNWDIQTVQYDFVGNVVLTIATQNAWSSCTKASTLIKTWNVFSERTGDLTEVKQKIDLEPWKTISKITTDGLGRLNKKTLGSNLDHQDFTYNIRGQLIGVNVANIISSTFPLGVSFAERLSYETGFTDRRYDGGLTGFEWKTPSTPQSAYGYRYDTLGRLISADYRNYELASGVLNWNKVNRDFSVAGLAYDENGNIQSMKQYGYNTSNLPGLIDDLTYTYDAGNRLLRVADNGVASPEDDFNNANATSTKYSYDNAGNMSEDSLKNLNITYNYNGLPLKISNLATSEKILNVYDAAGALIQKKIYGASGDSNTYTYWGPFVYKDDTLQQIAHAEGRARWIKDSGFFKYDYFVKDHLENVRTVITSDESPLTTGYLATSEVASANVEEALFQNLADVRQFKPQGNPGDLECQLLNGTEEGDSGDRRIGASIILRVMAGDKINASVYDYHEEKHEDNNYTLPEEMMGSLLNTLAGGVGGFNGGEEENGVTITNGLLNSTNYSIYDELKNSVTVPEFPRSYLNYLVFDQEYNLLSEQSGVVQTNGESDDWTLMTMPLLDIPQNGYVLLYLSNEENLDVYYDNLSITHQQGRLIEEQHYYPHGLLVKKTTITGVKPINRYEFQGNEMQPDAGLNLYDFNARNYDAQIGRFMSTDPLADNDQESISPYHFCANDPANFIDPSGLYPIWRTPTQSEKMLYAGPNGETPTAVYANGGEVLEVSYTGGGGGGNSGSGGGTGSGGTGSGTGGSGTTVTVYGSISGYLGGSTGVGNGTSNGNSSGSTGGNRGGGGGGSAPQGKREPPKPPMRYKTTQDWAYGRSRSQQTYQSRTAGKSQNAGLMQAGVVSDMNNYLFGLTGVLAGAAEIASRNNSVGLVRLTRRFFEPEVFNTVRPAVEIPKYFKLAGKGTFYLGSLLAVYQGSNALAHGDYRQAGKSGLDLGIGYYGLAGGAPGWLASSFYFSIDAFYPKGWTGFKNDLMTPLPPEELETIKIISLSGGR